MFLYNYNIVGRGENMEKVKFSKLEVLAFVEELILDQMANEDELEWYEEVKWNNNFKTNYTYKEIIKKMRNEYEEL
jgi:hypothetical protein